MAYASFLIIYFLIKIFSRYKSFFYSIEYGTLLSFPFHYYPDNGTVFRILIFSINFKFGQDFIGTAGYESVLTCRAEVFRGFRRIFFHMEFRFDSVCSACLQIPNICLFPLPTLWHRQSSGNPTPDFRILFIN